MTNDIANDAHPLKLTLDRHGLLAWKRAAGVTALTATVANAEADHLVDPRLAIAALVIAWRGRLGIVDNLGKLTRRAHLEQALVSALAERFAPAGRAVAPIRLSRIEEELRPLLVPAWRTILQQARLDPAHGAEAALEALEVEPVRLGLEASVIPWVLHHDPEQSPRLPKWARPWIDDLYSSNQQTYLDDPELTDPAMACLAQRQGNPFAVQLGRERVLLDRGPSSVQVNMISKWVSQERSHQGLQGVASRYHDLHGRPVPTLLFLAGVHDHAQQAGSYFFQLAAADFFAGAYRRLAQDPASFVDAIRHTLLTWFHYSPETWTARPHVNWNLPEWPEVVVLKGSAGDPTVVKRGVGDRTASSGHVTRSVA